MSILRLLLNDLSSVEKLARLIGEIDDLKRLRSYDPELETWRNKVLRFLKREFGEDSDYYKEFERIVQNASGIEGPTYIPPQTRRNTSPP